MRSLLLLGLLSASSLALAAPGTFQHQGRLSDSTGAAITGSHDLTLVFFDEASGGTELWREEFTGVDFEAGFYSVELGTVTPDVGRAVSEQKSGKVEYRVDKTGIVHCSIGTTAFEAGQLCENFAALIDAIKTKLLPLGDEFAFIPGHGPVSSIGAERASNPFLT